MRKLLSIFMLGFILFACLGLTSCKNELKPMGRYEINAEYREESRAVSGTVKVNCCNSYEKELDKIKFNLYPNAYRKNALYPAVGVGEKEDAYYSGESYGEITITSVNGGKTWAIEGADENILSVALVRPVSKGEEITLDISFVTELANVEHRLGVGRNAVHLAYFYPRLCAYFDGEFLEDESSGFGLPFRSDCADYEVWLTVPADYDVVGGGRYETNKLLESKTKYFFELDGARDFACVLAKKLKINSSKVTISSGKSVELAYACFDDKEEERMMEMAQNLIEYYSQTFGEYAYSKLNVISTGLSMESSVHTGIIFLSNSLSASEEGQALARGIARQWWGNCVASDEVGEAWQSEALAEYCAIAFFETHEGYGIAREKLVKKCLEEYRNYFSVYGSVFGGVDTKMSRPLKEYSSAHEYKCIARDKGVVMFDTLRKSVGDKSFFKALSYYYAQNAYSMVKPIAMYEAFEKRGVDVNGFFDCFLTGKAVL